MEIDDFVLLPRPGEPKWPAEELPEYLDDIDELVTELSSQLWPINRFIHDNPELGYHETQAHDTLVRFMKSKPGWKVTPSAFGIETAWQAVYDTERPGPVVNFNAEMGKQLQLSLNPYKLSSSTCYLHSKLILQ